MKKKVLFAAEKESLQNHIEYDKKCFNRIVKKLLLSDTPFTVDTIVEKS